MIWSSSDENIATVDQNGKVTGVSEGVVKITVTSANGIKGEANIIVKNVYSAALETFENDIKEELKYEGIEFDGTNTIDDVTSTKLTAATNDNVTSSEKNNLQKKWELQISQLVVGKMEKQCQIYQ